MLSHFLSHCSHTNTSEVIDGEASVARILCWEESIEACPQEIVSQAGLQFLHPQSFGQVLE